MQTQVLKPGLLRVYLGAQSPYFNFQNVLNSSAALKPDHTVHSQPGIFEVHDLKGHDKKH